MTDRSASPDKNAERKQAKKDEAKRVLSPTDPDPEVAAQLYEAEALQQAAREKAHEAEKLKAQSAQTAFGTPQMIHKSAPERIPGFEPSVRSAKVNDQGEIEITES